MATSNEKNLAFTLVADEGDLGYQTQDLRAALEKGTDELKLDTLRRIIVSTLNGQPQVSCRISRYILIDTSESGTKS